MSNWISKVPCSAAGAACAVSATALISRKHKLRIVPLYRDDAILQQQAAVEKPADRPRIDHVLLLEDPGGQTLRGIRRLHVHRGLDDDRSVIDLGGDEMHRTAVQLYAR